MILATPYRRPNCRDNRCALLDATGRIDKYHRFNDKCHKFGLQMSSVAATLLKVKKCRDKIGSSNYERESMSL